MQHYDLRIIEDCLVFSYEVEGPKRSVRQHQESCTPVRTASARKSAAPSAPVKRFSRRDRKRAVCRESVNRILRYALFLMLAPFLWAIDLAFSAAALTLDVCCRRPTYTTTLATVAFVSVVCATVGIL